MLLDGRGLEILKQRGLAVGQARICRLTGPVAAANQISARASTVKHEISAFRLQMLREVLSVFPPFRCGPSSAAGRVESRGDVLPAQANGHERPDSAESPIDLFAGNSTTSSSSPRTIMPMTQLSPDSASRCWHPPARRAGPPGPCREAGRRHSRGTCRTTPML